MTFVTPAYAADSSTVQAFGNALNPIIQHIVEPLLLLVFAIAIFVFVFGIFEMVWKGTDADAREKGRWHMLGGLIGMVIMLSAWGIINLVANTVKSI